MMVRNMPYNSSPEKNNNKKYISEVGIEKKTACSNIHLVTPY
jgi:hypothetical protein